MARPMYQNASLLRELRMFTQQFLLARRMAAPRRTIFETPAQVTPLSWVPKCIRCAERKSLGMTRNEPRDAVTLKDGDALCFEHV